MTEIVFSPLDARYKSKLPERLSEQASTSYQLEVEKAWLLTLSEAGVFQDKVSEKILEEAASKVTQEQISKIEERTQHATRALVEAYAERIAEAGNEKLSHWVHVGITSFDTVDTAQRLRLKDYFLKDALPKIQELKNELKRWALEHKETPQVGRTHGQWAVPTFFGLSFAESWERINELEKRLQSDLENLRGQASGAIGGYQATSLLAEDPLKLEAIFLKKINLKAHYSSLQILPPEDMVAVAQTTYLISSVVAKLAHDLRHLARSEIAEISEGLKPGQVGSSTMPQKRNPWNLEHICSLHKVLQSRLLLMEQDVLTEHQRDLTNSASGRFYFEFFAVAHLMWERLREVLSRMEAHKENMQKNLQAAGSSVYAEAFYVSLSKEGVADAHSKVREAARQSEKTGQTLLEVLQEQKLLAAQLSMETLEEKILKGSRLKFKTIESKWS